MSEPVGAVMTMVSYGFGDLRDVLTVPARGSAVPGTALTVSDKACDIQPVVVFLAVTE